ncbi:hypothetical protein ABZ816_36280 [Actinosynnema sp. NPDC047251]|uniref:Putative secreted protein n=1 Tax=Saccharothrix espanaensis (strain ATCC 51144 / DSM 44229 / JCM 9112 / NBRC 15066 / NRRL 15764) TaxID=1179773 RepID=K0JPQ1_SACES|nr:hypothetical protein [Saccharothrix espanaensis]CCH29055.1 putative secreted protein [Saccharothrix espanaensis DSM 44229]
MAPVWHPRRRPPVATATVATVATALGVALLIGGYAALTRADHPDPPSRAEAEAVLDDVVHQVRTGSHAALCESAAAMPGICRNLLLGATQAGQFPGQDRPEVIGTRQAGNSTTVLHLRGTRADGSGFTADFDVLRDHRGLRTGTTIYWSGVTIGH